FLAQYALEQKNNRNISMLQEYVYAAKEEAKQAGCFTEDIKNRMVENIGKEFNIPTSQIQVQLQEVPKYRVSQFDRRELIRYKVTVPIEKIMAGGGLFSISEAENRGQYTIESWTASEKLRE
ncbi:MAG: hypothetical protein RRY25_07980, partial [Anaerovorax sp.]